MHAGFGYRNSLHPECLSQDGKLFDAELIKYANEITASEMNDRPLYPVLTQIRDYITAFAPTRVDNGAKAPFFLSAHGTSDHYFTRQKIGFHCNFKK